MYEFVQKVFRAEPVLAYSFALGVLLAVGDIAAGVSVRDSVPLVIGPLVIFLRSRVSPA